MKIIRDTSDQLILESKPVVFGLTLVAGTVILLWAAVSNFNDSNTGNALICLVAGMGLMIPALFFALERVQVIFDTERGICTLRRRTLKGYTSEDIELAQITRAMVQTRKGTGGSGDSHRVALVIGADKLENRRGLTTSYASGPKSAAAVARVNDWLAAHRNTSG